jgi:hypothetical protein
MAGRPAVLPDPAYQGHAYKVKEECMALARDLGCICKVILRDDGGRLVYLWPRDGFDWEIVDPPIAVSWAGMLAVLQGYESAPSELPRTLCVRRSCYPNGYSGEHWPQPRPAPR